MCIYTYHISYKFLELGTSSSPHGVRRIELKLSSSSHMELLEKRAKPNYFSRSQISEILDIDLNDGSKRYPLERKISSSKDTEKHNVVLIMVESLTNRYVDFFGKNGYGLTPNLDRLAREGIAFSNFYAHGQRSIDGLQSILTGIPTIPGIPTLLKGKIFHFTKIGDITQRENISSIFVSSMTRRSFRPIP